MGDDLLHDDIKLQLCKLHKGRKDIEGTIFLFFALALLSPLIGYQERTVAYSFPPVGENG